MLGLIFRRRHHTVPPYLVFSTQPGGASSGSAFSPQPVVTAKNPDGTTKTSFTGVVTLALNALTGTPTLTGTATATAVAGVATFSGLGTTGGASTWTLTATSPGYSSATSSTGTTTAASSGRSDNFDRADSNTSLGSPSDGGSAWVPLVGTWGITSNHGYSIVGSDLVAYLECSAADGTIQVTAVATGLDNYGIAFRIVDASNYWRAVVAGGKLYVQKIIAGVQTTVISPSYTVAANDVMSVVLSGTSITVKVNGTTITGGALTDSQFQTATKHGLSATGGSTLFDNFAFA